MGSCNDWLISSSHLIVPSQTYVANSLSSFKENPQRQRTARFNLDDVMRSMSEGSGSK